MKTHIEELVGAALQALAGDCIPAERLPERAPIERTRTRTHGDFASNTALTLAKAAGMRPRELAERLIGALPASELIDKVDIAGPGFINFFLTPAAYHRELRTILEAGERYGQSGLGAARKTVVEFVSANPTGPLHVGHGRAAAVGDCLCRLLEATGWDVTREFYYNDAGRQISNLALSVQARCWGIGPDQEGWPEDGYRGDYIKDIARAYRAGATAHADDREVTAKADPDDLNAIRQFAVAYLRHEQDLDLHAFKVAFDVYSLESALYASGEVEATVKNLVAKGHTYEHAGALWLKTSRYGDDKDRVMRKSDGSYTYFLPDVAYHVGKWRRGFQYAINEHGADHHSTSVRVRAGLQALEMGIPQDWPEYVLHQMVTVMRGGAEVKISKRAGGYLTLRDLIDEVGRDATRFFFVLRASEQHLDFDLDLAKSRTHENPVYYIQYAHARVVSVFRQLAERGAQWEQAVGERHAESLSAPHEDALLIALSRFPEAVETAAAKRSPHLIAHYLHELANDFHTYYNAETFLVDDDELRNARLNLIQATAQVLKNGLALLGVSAPDSM